MTEFEFVFDPLDVVVGEVGDGVEVVGGAGEEDLEVEEEEDVSMNESRSRFSAR